MYFSFEMNNIKDKKTLIAVFVAFRGFYMC